MDWFTDLRAQFEDYILARRDYTNQAVRRHGSALKGSGIIFDLYESILNGLSDGKDEDTITHEILAKFAFLRDIEAIIEQHAVALAQRQNLRFICGPPSTRRLVARYVAHGSTATQLLLIM